MSAPALLGLFAALTFGWWRAPAVPGLSLSLRRFAVGPSAPLVARSFVIVVVMAALAWRWPMPTLTIGVGVIGWTRLRRRRRRRAAEAEGTAALPESLELCMVTLGAGGTVADCLRTLAASGVEPARPAAVAAMRQIAAGALLDEALLAFQRRLGPGYQPLSGALRLAAEQGGSVSALLDRLALEARAGRRRAGELRARRLSVLLLVPLVTFSLPAVLIGVLVPLALVALRHVS